jgi:hypothetical protein
MDEPAIQRWHCHRGRGFHYSDTANETALMLKRLFNLPLRALEGCINSLFKLMDVSLQSPDYSCISKRVNTVKINYRVPSKGPVTYLVIDYTGLKVYGMKASGKNSRISNSDVSLQTEIGSKMGLRIHMPRSVKCWSE